MTMRSSGAVGDLRHWGPAYVVVERAAAFRAESLPLALQGRRDAAGIGRLDGDGVLWQFLSPAAAFEGARGTGAPQAGASLFGASGAGASGGGSGSAGGDAFNGGFGGGAAPPLLLGDGYGDDGYGDEGGHPASALSAEHAGAQGGCAVLLACLEADGSGGGRSYLTSALALSRNAADAAVWHLAGTEGQGGDHQGDGEEEGGGQLEQRAQQPRRGGALGAPAPVLVHIWSNEPTPRLLCADEGARCITLLSERECAEEAATAGQLPPRSMSWACMPDMDGGNDDM